MADSTSASATLMPSQAINGSTSPELLSGSSQFSDRSRPERGREANKGKRNRKKSSRPPSSNEETTALSSAKVAPSESEPLAAMESKPAGNDNPKRGRRQRNGKKKENADDRNTIDRTGQGTDNAGEDSKPPAAPATKASAKKKSRKSKNQKKKIADSRYPWRKHIPEDSVDPITLEPLTSLPYPPFALVASAPYTPVETWPIPVEGGEADASNKSNSGETEEERHQRVLREQWGDKLRLAAGQSDEKPPVDDDAAAASSASVVPSNEVLDPKRHYHLYDGRALAYYCVSQLQFIDPLNRRDLTRDELVNLDRYLRKHGFTNLNVVEAYDVKGVTISTAGAAGNTAAGRAAILQQEARVLLNALFGGISVSVPNPRTANRPAPSGRSLRNQYQSHEESQQQEYNRSESQPHQDSSDRRDEDTGVYDGGGGYLVIDDDLNPGLRGATAEVARAYQNRHRHRQPGIQPAEFPSLSETSVPATSASEPAVPPKKPLPPSATLSRIATAVKKTDPEEQQRQWEARELARRKAMLSTMTFGVNVAYADTAASAPFTSQQSVPTSISVKSTGPISEAQLQRNQALAAALGVTPATLRQPSASLNGWARPSQPQIALDEFGKELQCSYPDELILNAKERMGLLLKVEKKLLKFLADDSAPSLPLNPMDRPSRAMVHEYLEYWKLQAQSYDPEPKRYIHCTKTLDTCAPYPLLSDAVRDWRGPRPVIASLQTSALASAVGPTRLGREIPAPPQRTPLPLKPRSRSAERSDVHEVAVGVSIAGTPTRTRLAQTMLQGTNSRVEPLVSQRERPKLQLAQRSLPLELPPYIPPQKFDVSEELQRRQERMQVQAQQEQERMRQQQAALEAAFASDDESGGGGDDNESDWDEQEALYVSSSEEE
jgi:R3H domain